MQRPSEVPAAERALGSGYVPRLSGRQLAPLARLQVTAEELAASGDLAGARRLSPFPQTYGSSVSTRLPTNERRIPRRSRSIRGPARLASPAGRAARAWAAARSSIPER